MLHHFVGLGAMNEAPYPATPFRAMASWMAAVAAAWLAVGSQPWPLTLLILAVGILYLVTPPSGSFPRSVLILSGLLLVVGAVAFLPAHWFPDGFRKPLLEHGVISSSTYSFQPSLSLEDFTLLVSSLLWAWLCFETKLSLEQREFLLSGYLIALGIIALNIIVEGTTPHSSVPSFIREAGRFANRNQTGDLLVIGGICSFARGLGKISRQKMTGILWMILSSVFLTAIIRNGSRAALILFGIGMLICYVLMPKARRHRQFVLAIVYIIIVLGVLLFIFQGADLRERFSLMLTSGRDGRLAIYRDAISMMMQNPWLGVGLGNFEGIFNTQRVYSIHLQVRPLHPESDWLWIATEMGMGGAIVMGLLVFLGFRLYLSKTPFPALTRTSAIIGSLFLIHSLFDVGGHRLGTVWNCLYLVGLGASRPVLPTDWRLPHGCLRVAGLVLLAIAFLRVQSASLHPWMPTRASLANIEAALNSSLPLSEQKGLLDESIHWAPLDWYLYYQRGLTLLQSDAPATVINADFDRSLYLEQTSSQLPIAIGDVCRYSDRPEAEVAWKNLLQRASPHPEPYFESLFFHTDLDERDYLELDALAGHDPNLETIAIERQKAPEFDYLRRNFLEDNPALTGIRPALLELFFERWLELGDTTELIAQWPNHPTWQDAGWRSYIRALARAGRYQEAVATGLRFLPQPAMPDFPALPNRAEAESAYRADPQDPLNGVLLYYAESAAHSDDEALVTLKEIAKLPGRPPYIQYLLVQKLSAGGQDQAAWQTLEPLLYPQG